MGGASSAFPAPGRKRRREEDHFFDSKGGFSSHGKQEAEAEEALEAEALALELENPWQCTACTVINVAARFSCEVRLSLSETKCVQNGLGCTRSGLGT